MSDANHHPSPPAMLWPDVRAFVVGSLPPPPARVLEVGAGRLPAVGVRIVGRRRHTGARC